MGHLKPADRPGFWSFETETMKGALCARADLHIHGITSLVQKATNRQVIQKDLFCLHLYRVLTRNHWLSQCRDVPHTGALEGDELVLRWPQDALGPGLTGEARYRLATDDSIDLAVSLGNTGGWHRDLELYTSNYFDHALAPGLYTVTPFSGPATAATPAILTAPSSTPATRSCYHVWPRDTLGAQRFTDGRWEHGTHSPVPWAIGRWFAYPFGFFATDDRRTLAVVMAERDDCFALCTSYRSDDPRDDVAHHNSLYHSLVGGEAAPGWRKTLRQRLVLTDWADDDAPMRAFEAFVPHAGD